MHGSRRQVMIGRSAEHSLTAERVAASSTRFLPAANAETALATWLGVAGREVRLDRLRVMDVRTPHPSTTSSLLTRQWVPPRRRAALAQTP
ncbi:hypothetical protein DEJ46_38225 [Streptomyces venezuelae]|uniref:Uncharacterized protein n=1 Tax=Streptomyces venezuelae TaxID=54571 RepID=A0A5P2B2G3_STRVZ|nr:hypothetical protein DEJ46_38225 [Streptomyces venezuelae]